MAKESPLKLEPPRRMTIVDSIIEQIVALIQAGNLKPGDRLPAERRLMEMLGVSRSSVREALQGLTAMGVVEVRAGEGAFIRQYRPGVGFDVDISTLSATLQKEMRHHLNQARLMLELEVVTLAAAQRTEADSKTIMAALEEYERHGEQVTEEMGWPTHDQIHIAIAEATQNPILVLLIKSLLEMVPSSLRNRGMLNGPAETVRARIETEKEIHRNLCLAIVQRDAEAAREWVRRHAAQEARVIDEAYG